MIFKGNTFDYKYNTKKVYECEKCGYRTIYDIKECPNPKCPKEFIFEDE